ncbi:MAG: STAS domain-containing protein [Proteobacteria bacterium]|nr:STAS domain-containing protein [Pseudomonadota bacterium]MBK8957560.1 STAS domain-containing protein [Pseudomonadota bacterium]
MTIRRDGQRLLLEGPVTLATHVALRDAAAPLMTDAALEIDWQGVEAVDSSALALILHWRREAAATGRGLTLRNLPAGVTALAELYGVSEFVAAV